MGESKMVLSAVE